MENNNVNVIINVGMVKAVSMYNKYNKLCEDIHFINENYDEIIDNLPLNANSEIGKKIMSCNVGKNVGGNIIFSILSKGFIEDIVEIAESNKKKYKAELAKSLK